MAYLVGGREERRKEIGKEEVGVKEWMGRSEPINKVNCSFAQPI